MSDYDGVISWLKATAAMTAIGLAFVCAFALSMIGYALVSRGGEKLLIWMGL